MRGALEFETVDGRTVVSQALAQSPLRFLNPKNHGSGAWVYTSNHGGGLVDGDAIALDVRLRPDARGVLLTQSATKVYRGGSSQKVEAVVEDGATLISIPDLVMCFEQARFSQSQTFHLGKASSLLLVDGLCCGRHASGECWRFDRYESRIEVHQDGRPIFLESLLFDSAQGNLASRNAPFDAFGVLLLLGPAFAQAGNALRERLSSEPLRADAPRSASVVAGGAGTLVRLAAPTSEHFMLSVRELLSFLPEALGDDPWARRF